jgi:hypothetical protein
MFLSILCAFLTTVSVTEPLPLGADHTPEEIKAQGTTCVHGYWVNQTDVFFHAGDIAALNQYLAKQKGDKLSVQFHQGTKKARSPWDKADRSIDVDWCITTGDWQLSASDADKGRIRIDVWLGGKIKRDEVKLPDGAKVEGN